MGTVGEPCRAKGMASILIERMKSSDLGTDDCEVAGTVRHRRLSSGPVTSHRPAQQSCLPRPLLLLPSLKNVMNEESGPVPEAGRWEKGWKDFKVMIGLQRHGES